MKDLLLSAGITEYGVIDFCKLRVITPHLLPSGVDIKSALMILMPYRCGGLTATDGLNAGLFARCRDYHAYFRQLSAVLIPQLEATSGGKVFAFADHSPVHEKDAAAKCGLGVIGKNSLLINSRYGSFVFIGTFLFEARLEERIHSTENNCSGCNRCIDACPVSAILPDGDVDVDRCLSFISQKNKKSLEESSMLAKHKTVWGCDICQLACPHNANAAISDTDYFRDGFIGHFSAELIDGMSDEEYRRYAFSYRKRKVIRENCLTATGGYDIIKKD